MESFVGANALLFDLRQAFFIALQCRFNWLQQRLDFLLIFLASLIETCVSAFEEGLLRLTKKLAADLGELRIQSVQLLPVTAIPFFLGRP